MTQYRSRNGVRGVGVVQSCRLVALDLSIGSAGTEGVVAVRDDANRGTGGKRKPFDVADVAVV